MNTNTNLIIPANTKPQADPANRKTKSHTAQFAAAQTECDKPAKSHICEKGERALEKTDRDKTSGNFSQTLEKKKKGLTEKSDPQPDQMDSSSQSQDQDGLDILPAVILPEMMLAKPLKTQNDLDQPALIDTAEVQSAAQSVKPIVPENQAKETIVDPALVQGLTEKVVNRQNPAVCELPEKLIAETDSKNGDILNDRQLQQTTANSELSSIIINDPVTRQPLKLENIVSNVALPDTDQQPSPAVKPTTSNDLPAILEVPKQSDDRQVNSQNENQQKNQLSELKINGDNTQNQPINVEQLLNVTQQVSADQQIQVIADQTTAPVKIDSKKDSRIKTEPFDISTINSQLNQEEILSLGLAISKPQSDASAKAVENIKNIASNQTRKDVEPAVEMISANNSPGATEKPTPFGATVKTFVQANTAGGAGEQIEQFIHSNYRPGSQQMVIRLDPPDLGKVVIKFSENGSTVSGLLQVDKSQTKDQIQQALPEMIQNLQNAGIGIKKIEVVLTNQQDYSAKDQSATTYQDGSQGGQNWSNAESQSNSSAYDQWQKGPGSDFTPDLHQQSYLSDNEINMLM